MTMASEPERETAFSARWKSLKSRAEEAGKQLAAQVKEQQEKFLENRAKNAAERQDQQGRPGLAGPETSVEYQQHEEALRIVQYQVCGWAMGMLSRGWFVSVFLIHSPTHPHTHTLC
jgi:hypothetical protein